MVMLHTLDAVGVISAVVDDDVFPTPASDTRPINLRQRGGGDRDILRLGSAFGGVGFCNF